MPLVAELEALLAARDHRGVAACLNGLDETELEAGRRWYRRTGRKQAREAVAGGWDIHVSNDGGTVNLLLAVSLAATGRDAARACAFTETFSAEWTCGDRLLSIIELAAARGPGWAQDFAESASQVKVRRPWDMARELALICLPLIARFDLDVPQGPGYVDAWVELALELQRPPHSPQWERCLARVDDTGRAVRMGELWPEAGLAGFLRVTPRPQQTLVRLLETPTTLGRLGDLDQPGWSAQKGIKAAVDEGLLDRNALVDAILSCYTRSDRPSEQRVTTQLLAAVDFGPADAAARVPFFLQVMPTVHGSVTAALLPALLGVPLGPDDLLDLGSTILLRKEKAQKVTLLDRLDAIAPDDPLANAAEQLWRQAQGLDDTTLATRAERALATLGDATEPDADPAFEVPWDTPVEPLPSIPFRRGEPTLAGLARLRAHESHDPRTEARCLDVVVRLGAPGPDALRAVARELEPVSSSDPDVVELLVHWSHGRPVEVTRPFRQGVDFETLVTMLVAETLLRVSTPTELLSTPSRQDGSLTFDDLVVRLRATAGAGYGPVDLLQALLRLEPTDPDRLHLLDGLAVAPYDHPPPRRRWWQRDTAVFEDAVPVVRAWVQGGGLPVRIGTVVDGRASCPSVRLPAVPPGLVGHPVIAALTAAVEPQLDEPDCWGKRTNWLIPRTVLGVVPAWSEAVAPDQECFLVEHRITSPYCLRMMVGAPGRLGPAVHLHAARLLGGPAPEERALAVEEVLVAVGQRRLDPGLFAQHSLYWVSSGAAPLARTSEAWEQVVLGGGLGFLWPTLRAALQHATTRNPKPAGLAELLRMVRPYLGTVVANVPDPVLPNGVTALAGEAAASKARAEARALVAAVASARAAA